MGGGDHSMRISLERLRDATERPVELPIDSPLEYMGTGHASAPALGRENHSVGPSRPGYASDPYRGKSGVYRHCSLLPPRPLLSIACTPPPDPSHDHSITLFQQGFRQTNGLRMSKIATGRIQQCWGAYSSLAAGRTRRAFTPTRRTTTVIVTSLRGTEREEPHPVLALDSWWVRGRRPLRQEPLRQSQGRGL